MAAPTEQQMLPRRFVDDLVEALPQDVAADIGLARTVNGQVLLACREPAIIDSERIAALTKREYEVLSLTAQAMTYKTVSEDLYSEDKTVRTHLRNTYTKFGVVEGGQQAAATFLPIEKSKLDAIPLRPHETEDSVVPASLSKAEADVFILFGQGFVFKQIGVKLDRSPGVVRTHATNIYDKLGITGDIAKRVALGRLAGSLPNLQTYNRIAGEVEAAGIAERVAEILRQLRENKDIFGIDLDADGPVYTTNNPKVLAELESGRHVPRGTTAHGQLSLDGLVAAFLLNQSRQSREIMINPHSHAIVRDLISSQVVQGAGFEPAKA